MVRGSNAVPKSQVTKHAFYKWRRRGKKIVAKAVIQVGGKQMANATTLKNRALALWRNRKSI